MALRKTLVHRLCSISTISSRFVSPLSQNKVQDNLNQGTFLGCLNDADSGDSGFLQRFLQKREMFQSANTPAGIYLPLGDKLIEKIRGLNKDRLRLDDLKPHPSDEIGTISINDAKKLIRLSQIELLKSKLKEIQKSSVSYSEFLQMCRDCVGGLDEEQISSLAKSLDESGVVIILENMVLLRPDQVARAIQSAISLSIDPQMNCKHQKEFDQMMIEKTEIDKQAENLVRRELWLGLCFLMAQTAGFMRLTFWELSWDVMEPICFFVTSIYFMAGYAFYLRTYKDPSFEGFFESRFAAKQKRLMKKRRFDLQRFNELRTSCDQKKLGVVGAPNIHSQFHL